MRPSCCWALGGEFIVRANRVMTDRYVPSLQSPIVDQARHGLTGHRAYPGVSYGFLLRGRMALVAD